MRTLDCDLFGLAADTDADGDASAMRNEVVALRRELLLRKRGRENELEMEVAIQTTGLVLQRTKKVFRGNQSMKDPRAEHANLMKTKTLEIIARCNVAMKHMPSTIAAISGLIAAGHRNRVSYNSDACDDDEAKNLDIINSDERLRKHLLLMDDALDSDFGARIEANRGTSFFGFGYCTDESPPDRASFAGMRFQITWVFVPWVVPNDRWEEREFDGKPPLNVEPYLADICHCPGKDGPAVYNVLELQFARIGCTPLDAVSGTGDGGGENEGWHGIHSHLEELNPTYVRRRCLGHFSWRVADQGITALGETKINLRNWQTYLLEGVTWTRLKAIAVQSERDGGLSLFPEHSPRFVKIFGTMPPKFLDGRPDTFVKFVRWSFSREGVLAQCMVKDLEVRIELKDETQGLIEAMRNRTRAAERAIAATVLQRGLYIFYHIRKHDYIASPGSNTSFFELVERASDLIMSAEVDEQFRELIGMTAEAIDARGWGGKTWIEITVRLVARSEGEVAALLDDANEFFQRVAFKMATHMRIGAENIDRTPLVCQLMLSTNARKAQEAANMLRDRLRLTPREKMQRWERSFVDDEAIMEQLDCFCVISPPSLLWRQKGAFTDLYIFLAVRFLSQKDHVLDAEGVHARWKWIQWTKRGIKLHSLSALLKLNAVVNKADGGDIDADQLFPLIQAADQTRRALLDDAARDPNVAPRARLDKIYRGRFNLSALDVALLKQARSDAKATDNTFEYSWGVFIRSCVRPLHFYAFSELDHERFFLVAEAKVLAGREMQLKGDALGRVFPVCWFEAEEHLDDGSVIVRPVGDGDVAYVNAIPLSNATLAEILRAAGHHPAVDPNASARDVEIELESTFLDYGLVEYESKLIPLEECFWRYELREPKDAEALYFGRTPTHSLTKLGLARRLHNIDGRDIRKTHRDNKHEQLVHEVHRLTGVPVGVAKALARKAKAKAKGKGGKKGKGKGPG